MQGSAKSFEQEDVAVDEENAKEILREVLNELYYSKRWNWEYRDMVKVLPPFVRLDLMVIKIMTFGS